MRESNSVEFLSVARHHDRESRQWSKGLKQFLQKVDLVLTISPSHCTLAGLPLASMLNSIIAGRKGGLALPLSGLDTNNPKSGARRPSVSLQDLSCAGKEQCPDPNAVGILTLASRAISLPAKCTLANRRCQYGGPSLRLVLKGILPVLLRL